MKIFSTLKTLPVISVLVTGLVLSPGITIADDSGRSKFKNSHAQSVDKHRNKNQSRREIRGDHAKKPPKNYRGGNRNYPHDRRQNRRSNYGHGHRNNYAQPTNYGYYRHSQRQRSPVHGYTGYTGYTGYSVRNSGHRRFLNLHDLRFILGIRTDNVDITLHD